MPHLIIEYSNNLAEDVKSADLVEILHYALGSCGLFKLEDVKTRSYSATDFLVGDQDRDGSFVHITLYIKTGRTLEQRQALSKTLLDMLQAHVPNADQGSVDIRELTHDVYQKFVN